MNATSLPVGSAPQSLVSRHFANRLQEFVWRNWQLVPLSRLAEVVGAERADLLEIGRSLGLHGPADITDAQQSRLALTIIRRNWHLLPYEQILTLLGWTEEQLAYALQEDDFLFIKLGQHKPSCPQLTYHPLDEEAQRRAARIAALVQRFFPEGAGTIADPLFSFVERLSQPPSVAGVSVSSALHPRFCYSYFALYGDPLLAAASDPYPDGYLARLAASGVDGVWLQGVLSTLAPFPWEPERAARSNERLTALQALVRRARRHGIGVYLYLNEPRSLPLAFYTRYPDLCGVIEGEYAALCTSAPPVQEYITEAIEAICRRVPDLAGFFTITASENLTNCWSRYHGMECPRCGPRGGAAVVAEVNRLIHAGIQRAGSAAQLIVYDWGWPDAWEVDAIAGLPARVALMSVSEWDLPIRRGGVESSVGEYALSAIGPGPRALRRWALARERGLEVIAKIQAGVTWELSAVPYVPAVRNAAQHVANVRDYVDGLMLGWTLGGYPSPNLEAVAVVAGSRDVTPAQALEQVALRRFGTWGSAVVNAWRTFSSAWEAFPYHIGVVYHAPTHWGPALPWWETPTGFTATMIGFPYDDLTTWRAVYPPDIFAAQCAAVAEGWRDGVAVLQDALGRAGGDERAALQDELTVADAVLIHMCSTANAARFIIARDALAGVAGPNEAKLHLDALERLLHDEVELARRLYACQMADSRIGFEASNQYYYVPLDLVEKVVNCYDLLERWLPEQQQLWKS